VEDLSSEKEVLWADRDRPYFVASAGSTRAGVPCERLIAYSCCAETDRHSRCRQDDWRLELKLGTHDWSQRVDLSFAARLHCPRLGATLGSTRTGLVRDAGDLLPGVGVRAIENTFDSTGWRSRTAQAATDGTVAPAYGVSQHLTPTTQRRAPPSGRGAALWAQRRCRVCRTNRTTFVCSECRNPSVGGAIFLCGPKTGRDCFRSHSHAAHDALL